MAACPDCGSALDESVNQLSEDEHTTELDCPGCGFGIETMSNLAQMTRYGL